MRTLLPLVEVNLIMIEVILVVTPVKVTVNSPASVNDEVPEMRGEGGLMVAASGCSEARWSYRGQSTYHRSLSSLLCFRL